MQWIMRNKVHPGILAGMLMATLIACKKDPSASLEIAITADKTQHLNTSVNVQEIWLNYSTKKSKSEWIKLDIAAGVYDLSDLYNDQRDTVIMVQTGIEDIQTLLQVRFTFGATGNSVITQANDTLSMNMSTAALAGIKVSLNKSVESGKLYDLRLAIKADSAAIHLPEPVFDPSIRVDSLTQQP